MGRRERINTPGTVEPANWTLSVCLMTVDELLADKPTTDRLALWPRKRGGHVAQT